MELESNLTSKLISFQREAEDKLQSVDGKLTDSSAKIRREIEEKETALSGSISTRYVCGYVCGYVCMYVWNMYACNVCST